MAHDLLERESLDGEEVYGTIREMTGHEHAPTRPVPPGEGLVVGGNQVPEAVVTPRSGVEPQPQPDEVEAEVAGAQRRARSVPVSEPEQSA